MTETLLGVIIGGGISTINTAITLGVNAGVQFRKRKSENQQEQFKVKRSNLQSIYTQLINIVNLFPNQSPNDILRNIEYGPHFLMESFDSIITSLNYQIENYHHLSDIVVNNDEQKSKNQLEIEKREYVKNEIIKIKSQYFEAREEYRLFCHSSKNMFDLYAGQNVKNCLVEFEVVIKNVFVSGKNSEDSSDPYNNLIENTRLKLISCMRSDIGI